MLPLFCWFVAELLLPIAAVCCFGLATNTCPHIHTHIIAYNNGHWYFVIPLQLLSIAFVIAVIVVVVLYCCHYKIPNAINLLWRICKKTCQALPFPFITIHFVLVNIYFAFILVFSSLFLFFYIPTTTTTKSVRLPRLLFFFRFSFSSAIKFANLNVHSASLKVRYFHLFYLNSLC